MTTLPRFASSALRLANTAYVNFGAPPVLSDLKSFTAEAWVRPDTVTGSRVVIAKRDVELGGQFDLFLADGRVSGWCQPDNYILSDVSIKAGEWSHLALVYDHAIQTVTLYVDGQPAAELQASFTSAISNQDLLVGAILHKGAPGEFFQGLIGEVMIWGEARSAEDILDDSVQMSYQGDTAVPALLLDYDWTTLPTADWSGNDLQATLVGADYALTIPGVHLQKNAYIDCGNSADLSLDGTKPYTIEGWFYPSSSADGTLVSKLNAGVTGEYAVFYESSRVVSSRNVEPFVLKSSASIAPGSYYHFATTYDQHTQVLSLYINGNLQAARYFPATTTADVSLLIGAQYASGKPSKFFQGYIQNIRVWNVCHERDEILQWMYNQPVSDPTLIASFDFCVDPPVDTTGTHAIQLKDGAKIGELQVRIAPGSTEGLLGFVQSLNADYFNQNSETPVPPPHDPAAGTRSGTRGMPGFTEEHRAATWNQIERRIRESGGGSEAVDRARRGFERAYREAARRASENPDLLKVITITDEQGLIRLTYHGLRGDVVILTAPSGSIDLCTVWWIGFDYHVTVGFFQALGLLPTTGDIAVRVYNLLTSNRLVEAAMMAFLGSGMLLMDAMELLLVIYQQGLWWPVVKYAFTAAGWWTLAWLLKKSLELFTGTTAAAVSVELLFWAKQLADMAASYSGSCGSAAQLLQTAPSPSAAV